MSKRHIPTGSTPTATCEVQSLLVFGHTPCECEVVFAYSGTGDATSAAEWKRYRLFHRGGEMILERIVPEPEAKPADGGA